MSARNLGGTATDAREPGVAPAASATAPARAADVPWADLAPGASARRSPDDLRALAEAGNAALGSLTDREASPAEVVAWAARHFATDAAAVACSMADAALPHLVAEHLPGVDVLFLDTGYHFAETRVTRDEVARQLDVRVVDVLPEQTVAEQDAEFGAELFARDPGLCCARRKVAPLQRALAGYEVWFTGVRRDESPTRAQTPLVTFDERNGLVKVNPVAAWSFDDLLDYAGAHAVPVNLLMSHGYPSIGCEPCTKPVAAGDDPRSGRWAGLAKTECGLHL
ncbi:phosphoadenylyl-sulfate reductase [Agromyces sp. SYSU T00194]|uniref:phosphoadenylyl-sulfate reductase n=1 Tax=Agromyces chitinivorans TaxID=3158560 RepID=UPI0033956301